MESFIRSLLVRNESSIRFQLIDRMKLSVCKLRRLFNHRQCTPWRKGNLIFLGERLLIIFPVNTRRLRDSALFRIKWSFCHDLSGELNVTRVLPGLVEERRKEGAFIWFHLKYSMRMCCFSVLLVIPYSLCPGDVSMRSGGCIQWPLFTVSGASTAGTTRQIEAQAGPTTKQTESVAIAQIADRSVACQQRHFE